MQTDNTTLALRALSSRPYTLDPYIVNAALIEAIQTIQRMLTDPGVKNIFTDQDATLDREIVIRNLLIAHSGLSRIERMILESFPKTS